MSIELNESTVVSLPKPNYQYIADEENARRAMEQILKYNVFSIDLFSGFDCSDLISSSLVILCCIL